MLLQQVSGSAETGAVRSPVIFRDIPYTPASLLDCCFPIALLADAAFSTACRVGFDAYFEDMFEAVDAEVVCFVERFYTSVEVRQRVHDVMLPTLLHDALAWRIGVTLGWLSALALSQPIEAQQGLERLKWLALSEWSQRSVQSGS